MWLFYHLTCALTDYIFIYKLEAGNHVSICIQSLEALKNPGMLRYILGLKATVRTEEALNICCLPCGHIFN